MHRAPLFWAASLALAAGCLRASSTNGPANYRGAALGAAFGVAAAGVNRALTGDCWASCLPGTYCDNPSGLCKKLERPEDIPSPYPTGARAADQAPIDPLPARSPAELDAGADAADAVDAAARD
jgi:hypothetical protein